VEVGSIVGFSGGTATVVNNQSKLNELIDLIAVLQLNQFNPLVLRFAINST
jgi:hypothetical protein